jgi:hypothetical protein
MMKRSRVFYLLAILVVIFLGLESKRIRALGLYTDDALWALMVFLWLGFLFRPVRGWKLALAAWAISWAVEFSQLYHAPWIDGIRANPLARLVIGSNFSWFDFIAYVIGIGAGLMAEEYFRKRAGVDCGRWG